MNGFAPPARGCKYTFIYIRFRLTATKGRSARRPLEPSRFCFKSWSWDARVRLLNRCVTELRPATVSDSRRKAGGGDCLC